VLAGGALVDLFWRQALPPGGNDRLQDRIGKRVEVVVRLLEISAAADI
jgi:hypothetical protein